MDVRTGGRTHLLREMLEAGRGAGGSRRIERVRNNPNAGARSLLPCTLEVNGKDFKPFSKWTMYRRAEQNMTVPLFNEGHSRYLTSMNEWVR